MELCNAGSLYEVIESPEHAYGLDETQFKAVIRDVGRYIDPHMNIIRTEGQNKMSTVDSMPG